MVTTRTKLVTKLLATTAVALGVFGPIVALQTSAIAESSVSRTLPPNSAALCTTAQLVVWLDSAGSGAAGSVYYHVEFTNQGSHTCTMFGYPGVSAVNLQGAQLGAPANKNAGTAKKLISLALGATASAVLQITDTGVYSPSTCRPTRAAGIRVYPPGQTVAKVVPYPFLTCGRAQNIALHIEAVSVGVLPN